ncbi:MAG: AAA family ATPase [Alphaproteobacteria bacterium]|nr:AAA family ATPase [Alphaproteobacteria bacterium]
MRLKTFEAGTYQEVRKKVVDALGDDAIISNIREHDGIHQITCVVDPDESEKQVQKGHAAPSWQIEAIHHALRWHQLPLDISDRLIDDILSNKGKKQIGDTLTMGLRHGFKFEPLDKFIAQGRPILLFGPPGMGKTVTAAKLALHAQTLDKPPTLIAADMIRTGGVEQLELYAEKLDVPFRPCLHSDKLGYILSSLAEEEVAIIDTPGINPFRQDDLSILKQLIDNQNIVTVLVFSTLIDTQAGIDIAEALSKRVETHHLIVTGEDIDRRLGRVLAIAEQQQLRLAHYSPRAEIVDGLADFSAAKLSELLLADIPGAPKQKTNEQIEASEQSSAKQVMQKIEATPDICENLVVIASGKGGVGKTFMAASLAGALGKSGHKTLLFDGDLGLANIDIQLGLRPKCDLGKVFKGEAQLEDAITKTRFFDVIAGRSGASSLTNLPLNKIKNIYHILEEKVCPNYDIVLADMGAGLEEHIRYISGRAKITIVIANDEPTALTDAYAFIKVMIRQKPSLNVKVLINSAENDRQGERTYKTLGQTCKNFLQMQPELLGIVKRDKTVHDSIRAQKLLFEHAPNAKISKDIQRIAENLWDKV